MQGSSLPSLYNRVEGGVRERESYCVLHRSGRGGPVWPYCCRPPPLQPGTYRAVCGAGDVETPPLRRSTPLLMAYVVIGYDEEVHSTVCCVRTHVACPPTPVSLRTVWIVVGSSVGRAHSPHAVIG